MFYFYKLIENAGFKSAAEFVEYYFKRHKNCCFKHKILCGNKNKILRGK